MLIHLQVRRFFCSSTSCVKQTFAEQVAGLTTRHGKRTTALSALLQAIALALGGRAGSRLSRRLAAGVSRSTLTAGLLKVRIVYAVCDQRKEGIPMAQKVQVSFVDDIDGSDAEGTVRFGLDGTDYEIDLNAGHTEALRTALTPFVEHSRKVGGLTRRAGRGGRRRTAGGLNTAEVREWAKAQGIEIKARGRVPTDVVAKYREATGK